MWIYTSPIYIALILGLVFVCLYMLFLLLICQSSDEVVAELKKLEDEAKLAADVEELKDIEISLRLFHTDHCWHKSHTHAVNGILRYIEGRLREMK